MTETTKRVLPGQPYPLGASVSEEGVNFAVYSESAEGIELCFYDSPTGPETEKVALTEKTGFVWHGFVPGLKAGQLYGFRMHGRYEPQNGLRFNPAKLLIDPYARALAGGANWQYPLFDYINGEDAQHLTPDSADSAPGVPKSVVVDVSFDWEDDAPLRRPWNETVIYETHVKGFSYLNPNVPEELRGTYEGISSPASIEHFEKLGVTAVELLPVQAHIDSDRLTGMGLVNYWGYDTIAFLAPESRYGTSEDAAERLLEFKRMVRELHRHGIEVILDVVYNHTPEGNEMGPTLAYRGLDNGTYYRLVEDDRRFYMDFTGCGNTLNLQHPQVLQLVMDSLRYWVQEMHVDGFRFDLASTLARAEKDFDTLSSFFDAIHQDPVLSLVKLIAEPWDVGDGGYQVGNFPTIWSEWNAPYRDAVRRFWRGDDNLAAEMGYRLTGSSDIYEKLGRRPYASINFVTAHDGFTLEDLVSYNEKHNEANGEDNNDGNNDNLSNNWGAEGPTDNPSVLDIRGRVKRSFLATLAFSQGVPMICGGDEMGRTQRGNNNSYCQDNEISWQNWDLSQEQADLLEFTRRVFNLRKQHPSLRRRNFFSGREIHGDEIKDISWLRPDGKAMEEAEWDTPWLKCFGVRLDGHLDEVDAQGEQVVDSPILLLFNADSADQHFTLPPHENGSLWRLELDTATPGGPADATYSAGETYLVPHRGVALLIGAEGVDPPLP